MINRQVETRLPTEHGEFRILGYRDSTTGLDHVALVAGDVRNQDDVLVRVHSECLTGDVLGSLRCDCGPQLHAALDTIAEAGQGVLIYLRGQEGRGIGLIAKLRAYSLQDDGADTVDANLEQGLPVDGRNYSAAVEILDDLGVASIRLISNNPDKRVALSAHGVEVHELVSLPVQPNRENIRYLRTKRDRMGHILPAVAQWDSDHAQEQASRSENE